jgi:hypothetical protein
MSYKKYETQVAPICPVAIKLGQVEVNAPEHSHWGIVSCDGCEDKFAIGPNRVYGSRRTDVDCAKASEAILAEDHTCSRLHANSLEIHD